MRSAHTYLLIISANLAFAGFCRPASTTSGGMTDVMLVYVGPKRWRPESFRPYVAYLDKGTGKARDWFFDGWLFCMYGGAPSKQTYISGATNKPDWLYFLDLLWQPECNLHALENCTAQVGKELSDPEKVFPVIIMIPYPSTDQVDFGDVDGDGRSENLSNPGERFRAVQWFIDEFLRRWRDSSFSHLKLWGFYWVNENVPARDEEIVRRTSELVHTRGYKVHWIPWHAAPGYEKWRELGFDFVVMQPNFAFLQPGAGLRLPNEDRLTDNTNRARAAGMGVEIELNGRELRSWESRWNLTQYLNHGVDELDGYMKGAARAWYQSYASVRALYESDNPQCNRLYDDIYSFHKGVYRLRVTSQAEGRPCEVLLDASKTPLRDGGKLTDGLWVTRGERLDRAIVVNGRRAVIRIDLGVDKLVEDIRVHLVGRDFPSSIRVRTGRSEGRTTFAGQSHESPTLEARGCTLGFTPIVFPARLARHVEVELIASAPIEMMIDEVMIPPAGHLLLGASYKCSGRVTNTDATALTDGVCGGAKVSWQGKGAVTFRLDELSYARLIRAHFLYDGAPPTVHAVLNGRRAQVDGLLPGKEGWAEASLDPTPLRELKLVFDAEGEVACDEVQLLPAVSLAIGKPYTLSPPFEPTYPDDGKELTDGALTQHGFSDGKTVGWVQVSPCIVFDLGERAKIDRVRIHAQGGGYAWVNFPHRVSVAASLDGEAYERVCDGRPKIEMDLRREVPGGRLELGWMTFRFPSRDARFVRVRFETTGWTMLSEIEVLSADKNVARGAAYSLRPLPSSKERYADNETVLTDGRYSAGGMWRGCAGWSKDDPTVTLDLQAPEEVGAFRVHLIGGGAGAVFFPSSIELSVSLDGRSWRDVGAVADSPEETGEDVTPGSMGLKLGTPVHARFARVHLHRRGWVMLDEIEVYPP